MDSYLESLVVKGEVAVDEVVAETEETAAEVEEISDAEIKSAESLSEEALVENEPEKPTVLDQSDVVEEVSDAIVQETTASKDELVTSKATAANDIKIFNTPDPKGPFKIFSGNVIIKGQIADMTQIEYMKPGFGLVKGFTPDIK